MTIDPVHYDGIAALADRIAHDADPEAHRDLAETVWKDHLDPLRKDGKAVLEPIDSVRRKAAPIEDLALQDAPFDTAHGLDSGTINPTTFKNGLLLDLAQAAMSAEPSDLELHRARTYIMPVHSNDASVDHGTDGWVPFDEEHGRGRIVQTEAGNTSTSTTFAAPGAGTYCGTAVSTRGSSRSSAGGRTGRRSRSITWAR